MISRYALASVFFIRCFYKPGVDFVVFRVFSFNGEPQADVPQGQDACGLPLNDEIISPRTHCG